MDVFRGPYFMGLDEMHLFGLRISEHIKRLFTPINNNLYIPNELPAKKYPFYLDGVKLADAGKDMLLSRKGVPSGHFDGSWDDNVARSGRAVDKLDFLLYIVPTLLIPYISDKTARKALNCLVLAIHMCLQWEFTTADRKNIER
jgi:hypothetical protein